MPVDGAQSAILVIRSEKTEVIAIDTRGSLFYTLPLPHAADFLLYQYSCPLEALDLEPGVMDLADRGRPIPAADRILTASLEETWRPATSVPDDVALIRLDANPCIAFDVKTHDVPGADARVFLRTTPGKAFLATRLGLFEVTIDGVTPLTHLSTATPHQAGVFRDEEIWMIGERGEMVHGLPETGFVPAPGLSSQSGERVWWLDASPEDEPFELFAMTDERVVEYFDGNSWSELGRIDGDLLDDQSDLARIDQGEAVVIGMIRRDLQRWNKNGTVRREELPLSIGDTPSLVKYSEEIGLMIGTLDGFLVNWSDRTIMTTPIDHIREIAPIEGGFLVTGDGGLIVQHQSGYGFCDEITKIGSYPNHIRSLGEGVYAVVSNDRHHPVVGILTHTSSPIPHRCP